VINADSVLMAEESSGDADPVRNTIELVSSSSRKMRCIIVFMVGEKRE